MWNGEEEAAGNILSDLLFHTISHMDYGEDYYHAFLTGIFVGRDGYNVQSNKESGTGRPDIMICDKYNHRAIIIESKRSKYKEQLDYCCQKALKQIQKEQYAEGLDQDVYHTVLCYGIAFYKKTAEVKN